MTGRRDRILGCLLGGALGDVLGVPYEGKPAQAALEWPEVSRISDDTQLTLATCEGVVASSGRVDPSEIAKSMSRWFRESRLTGIGASTYKALSELTAGGHWALVGRKGEMAAGNGAAMRIAPLAFVLDPTDYDDRVTVRDVCRITHHNDEAYVGALAIAIAVRAAWTGSWAGEPNLRDLVVAHLPDSRVRDRLHELRDAKGLTLREIAERWGSSGYVVESVPLALCGAERSPESGFRATLEELVLCGGDTDTVASMAGQVAGTLLGFAALPKVLLDRLEDRQQVVDLAESFAAVVSG